jgi:CheY-like chemotaxis protein
MQKVLIAEDSKTIREILGGILAREGYEIMKAPMDRLPLRGPVRSLLILMDIWMA